MTTPQPPHDPLRKQNVPPPPSTPPTTPPPPAAPPSGAPVYGYPHPSPEYGYPQAPASPVAYGYPAPGPAAAAPGQPLVVLGDIIVTSTEILTPAGPIPLRGAVWTVTDLSRTEERIAPAGIVLAIVFFVFCLLGLLFLLMKERHTVGHVQITVTGGGRYHTTSIPVSSPHQVMELFNGVNYARSLSI
ncbi:hypothetical protein AB0K51_23670 [Kitasatospora sp. NPDC049285]|uniref:hypothetical protein n=1 Tax=Kitasatospora sp. NPDC049285 TaxID=3157096 RepID=UPI003418534C